MSVGPTRKRMRRKRERRRRTRTRKRENEPTSETGTDGVIGIVTETDDEIEKDHTDQTENQIETEDEGLNLQ